MNTKPNDGGPAFPTGPGGDSMHGNDGRVWHQFPPQDGMSLRAYFAGQALASTHESNFPNDEAQARRSVSIADALLAELAKETPI